MSSLAGSRATRPTVLALLLTLTLALAGPLMLRPTPAAANVCDAIGLGGACGNGTAAGGVVNGVGDGASAVAGGVASVVAKAASWSGKNAGRILKAAVVAGIAIGTWVGCSKVLKVVAAGAGAAAATPETAGAGTAAGGIAGAAAAGAVCKLVKKAGGVVLKVAKKGLKRGGRLANIAKLAAGATGIAALVYGTQHAAAWVLQNLLDLDRPSAPALDASWLSELRSDLNAYAGVVLLIATFLALTFIAMTGRLSSIGRTVGQLITVALIIGIVGSLLLTALQFADAVTAGVMHSTWGQKALGNWKDLGDSYAAASPVKDAGKAAASAVGQGDGSSTPGLWVVRLVIAIVMVICGALVWLEMLVRDALLYLLLAFSGLLLAGYPFRATRQIAQRFGMTLLAIVVAKPVIIVTLLLGGTMMQHAAGSLSFTDDAALAPLLQGAGLMALAAFMGWHIVSWFHLHGVGAMGGVGARVRDLATGDSPRSQRPGRSAAGDGAPGSGSAGEPAGSADSADSAGGLARATMNRVGSAAGASVGPASAAVAGISSRLQAARAHEQSAATTNAPIESAATEPTASPAAGGRSQTVDAADAGAMPAQGRAAADHAEDPAGRATIPAAGGSAAGAPRQPAAPTAVAPDARATPTPAGMDAPAAPVSGDAGAGAGDRAPAPVARTGDQPTRATVTGAPAGAPAATVPSAASEAAFGRAETTPTAGTVFGRSETDAAAAFGAHSDATRQLVAAQRTAGRA